MTVEIRSQIWREGAQYVAHAMPIDVMSSGPTPEKARSALDEAVRCFLLTVAEQGTLREVMEECGYFERGDTWISPELVAIEQHPTAVAV